MKQIVINIFIWFTVFNGFAQSPKIQFIITYNTEVMVDIRSMDIYSSKDTNLYSKNNIYSPGLIEFRIKDSLVYKNIINEDEPIFILDFRSLEKKYTTKIRFTTYSKIKNFDYFILNIIDNKKLLDYRFKKFSRKIRKKLGKEYIAYTLKQYSDGAIVYSFDIIKIQPIKIDEYGIPKLE